MSALLLLLGIAVIVFGVVALVAPILPGVAIIYLGILIVAWADHFTRIGPLMLFVMLGLMLVALVADNVAALFGARRAGASGVGSFRCRRRRIGRARLRAAGRGAGARRGRARLRVPPQPRREEGAACRSRRLSRVSAGSDCESCLWISADWIGVARVRLLSSRFRGFEWITRTIYPQITPITQILFLDVRGPAARRSRACDARRTGS